jgi:predicted MFS family arabinose efflux permease
MPVRRRLLVDAAGSGNLAAALGFDNSTMYATRALGPLIGGATYQFLGIEGIYALIASSYFICIMLATRLGNGAAPAAVVGRTRIGLHLLIPPRALMLNRHFQIMLGVTLVYNLWCWPFVMMVPVIAQRDFGLPPTLVGALAACEGVGGAIGALLVGVLSSERSLFRFYYLGAFSFLTLMLALALHLTPGTAVVILLVIGMASAAFSATQYALVYTISPPDMRGRATGVLSLFIGSSMLGHYHAGLLFEHLGSSQAMMVMAGEGALVMVILGVLWWRAPAPDT